MAVSLSLLGGAGWQFFDNSGNVLSGGLLYTYNAGTTTPAATYTTISGAVANTNPIILDSSGRAPNAIWLTVGQTYKFALQTSAAIQIGVWDEIPPQNSGKVGDGVWNSAPARFGAYYLWVDSSGRLRIKATAPTSDTDGTVVGTQT